MDQRITEIEQLIRQVNDRQLAQKVKIQQSRMNYELVLSQLRQLVEMRPTKEPIKKDIPTKKPQAQSESVSPQKQPQNVPDIACSKCGEALKAGVKFCKHCGARTDIPAAVPQPASVDACACGAKIVKGAKFCRECGKPVR